MPTDSPSQGGRRHFHRGRRGNERRGGERRTSPQQQNAEQGSRSDHVDVEQIMREIRSKIAQRHGVELTDQQVQELAARRLESILDPRTIKPSLLEQLRRAAGTRPDPQTAPAKAEPPYTFEDTTLFESPNGFVRFMRKLLAPILKLFFNPNPLIRALNIQSRLNAESVKREAERDQRQAEWNALHYELLQRVVSETARVSLEVQSLALRVESLSAKVDFNERRVRGLEGTMHQGRPAAPRERDRERERDRDREVAPPDVPRQPQQPATTQTAPEPVATQAESPANADTAPGDAPRRRRRRRRGRRGGAAGEGATQGTADASRAPGTVEADEGDDELEGEGTEVALVPVESAPMTESAPITTEGEAIVEVSRAPSEPPAAPQREPAPAAASATQAEPFRMNESSATPEEPAPERDSDDQSGPR